MTDVSMYKHSSAELAIEGQPAADAIDLLTQDHRTIEGLFADYFLSSTFHRKARIAKQICDELSLHVQLEEEFFYPAARAALGSDDHAAAKSRVEHATLKWLIAQIRFDTPASSLFEAKIDALQDYFRHHAHEEEVEIFPRVTAADISTLDFIASWVTARVEPDDDQMH